MFLSCSFHLCRNASANSLLFHLLFICVRRLFCRISMDGSFALASSSATLIARAVNSSVCALSLESSAFSSLLSSAPRRWEVICLHAAILVSPFRVLAPSAAVLLGVLGDRVLASPTSVAAVGFCSYCTHLWLLSVGRSAAFLSRTAVTLPYAIFIVGLIPCCILRFHNNQFLSSDTSAILFCFCATANSYRLV